MQRILNKREGVYRLYASTLSFYVGVEHPQTLVSVRVLEPCGYKGRTVLFKTVTPFPPEWQIQQESEVADFWNQKADGQAVTD